MAKVDHSTSFYQKMAELQEKLKRSEEERMQLEEKFSVMMKSCRDEEEKRVRALRERYEKFLEDDKRRRDRNERILQTLEKIESRASALTAKSERLKLLRRHYEAYLIRMYPLWKKQSSSASQPSFPTNYPLSLPMDSEKGLAWFGRESGSGLYTNNMPLPSARSSLSPGSDQMWVPPALSRNIPLYDNSKQTIGHKQMEVKNSMVESSSPVVEGALDNYLQRAAELLRVPVEELEGHSEKRDEEKSVHTEQDTSRDLLNVSLSDDSILFEKKAEKTRGNATIVNKKEMVEEEEPFLEVDHLAGGDNMLSELQAVRFHEQEVWNQPNFAKDSENVQEENMYNSSKIGPEIANVNKNITDINCIPSAQEFLPNEIQQNIQEDFEERHASPDKNKPYIISNENIEYNNVDNADTQDPFAKAAQQEYVDNASRFDASYENKQYVASDVQQSGDDQLHLSSKAHEISENVENLQYALEQESTNEEQEYIENICQNETDLPQEHTNIIPQEYTGNQEGTAQIPIEDEQERPMVAIDESQLEKDQYYGEYAEAQYRANDQNYVSQDVGQYEQEQYVENPHLQYEQYPNNSQQYEQVQYIGNEEQLYEQQYSEQYSNEQCTENSLQLEESHVDNEGFKENEKGTSKEQYRDQLIDPNQQNRNDDQINEGEINDTSADVQNADQDYYTYSEREPYEHVASTQPALNVGTKGILEATYQAEKESVGDETLLKDNMNNQECTSQGDKLEQEDGTNSEQILENPEREAKDATHQETIKHLEEEEEERIGEVDKIQDQQFLNVNVAEQPLVNTDSPSAKEDDSEESSTGFWNPPHQSSIPSVDELAPKAAVITEDTSESSADSKMDPPPGKPSVPNTVQQFRTFLGVPTDPAGDAALSDQDEVEDQIAALVEDPSARTPVVVESNHDTKTKEVKPPGSSQKVKEGKLTTVETIKSQKDTKDTNKSVESVKPMTRTGLKKPPSLIKVLESDTESLNLETGAASNVDSDEFDFSTE